MTGPTIAVDGTPLSRPMDGIGRWSANVLRETALARPDWRFVVLGFTDDRARPYLLPDLPNVERVLLPVPRRAYQAVYSLVARVPVDRLVPRVDALVSTNYTAFPALRVPSVVTVFDLAYVDLPDVIEKRNLAYLRKHVPRSMREAAAITTISPFTAARIDAEFPGHAPVHLVDCGLDPAFLAPLTAGPALPSGYVLAVGTLEPRKNLVTLLRAWARVDPAMRRAHPLVIVGRDGWGSRDLPADVPADVLAEVSFTGYVEDADLPAVYAGATLFAFPSLYEGFGLPLLEAMASGVPAVVSDIPPFREIGAGLVDYVDPLDPRAFAEAISVRLTRAGDDRAAQARTRAREWTWERSGRQMAETIEGVLA
ncbi:glycosyltransferase family 4 protein [Cellulomonas fengjieae]|uniref:glycosyltransferase family 4 protein n=1 Tax=Cellulomonas fengjieae TaxID=2819978 RepID=UPI001AAF9391|nr:glycosyltransferase family 1 protein [Cellulomonas fengjieae]MBO3101397.1 glycosyltransferase family 4 protein [Cellulomonas fengjieae]